MAGTGERDEERIADIELRPWTARDLGLMGALLGDPAMTEHLGGPETPEQLERRLARYVGMGPETGRGFVVTVGAERKAAGSVGYWPNDSGDPAVLEAGWSVLPAFQGHGLASLATSRCLDVAAAEGYRTVHAYPAVDNGPSNAVCRKLGFELLGAGELEYPKGTWMTCNDWALDLVGRAVAATPDEIVGERVALGPLRPELFPLHQTWVNDPEVGWNVFGAPQARTFEEERDWLVAQSSDPANRFWLVYRTDEHRPIGVTSLTEIDPDAGSAVFRILIGAPRDRGHGFGSEAARLVLDRGFGALGLRVIRLSAFSWNEAGIRLYRRLGFRETERRPLTTERDGVRWDTIRMALPRPPGGGGRPTPAAPPSGG